MPPTDLCRRLVLGAALLLGLPLAAAGQVGIRNSSHDFSAGSAAVTRSNDPQICKFCHAPHRALSTRLLWNHTPSAQSYNWTGLGRTTTLAGTQLPLGTNIGEPSKKCLSCHDGTVALASLENDGTPGHTANLTFTGNVSGGRLVGVNVVVSATGDLSANHPFSIPYPGGTYRSVTSSPLVPVAEYQPLKADGTCRTATGICTTASAGPVDGAVIQLYPTVEGSLSTASSGLECGTCHEPHNQYGNAWLLRLDAQTSNSLCLACHVK